jgi:HPt (histidine-containing phosphotransfer) domain-containing protein
MTTDGSPEAIGDAAALDRLERFGGLKLRQELTTLFLQEAPSRIASARAALARGDVDAVRAMAHTLKSSAGQMGALRVQQICEGLEGPELPPDLPRALSDLDEQLARYIVWLDTITLPPVPT